MALILMQRFVYCTKMRIDIKNSKFIVTRIQNLFVNQINATTERAGRQFRRS